MKHFKCPHCKAAQSHPECSLYSVLECSNCQNLYRLADAIHYEGFSGAVSQWWTNLWSPYETGQQTACIYCNQGMPLQFRADGSFAVPDRCPHCTSVLPGRREPRPVQQKSSPKPVPAFNFQKPKTTTESLPPIIDPPVFVMDMAKLAAAAPVVAPAPIPVAPAPIPVAPAPIPVAPAPIPVAPAPVAPAPVAPVKLTGHYKDIYRQAVEANGGKDLTEKQFQELLGKMK